jgi:anti-sigma factor RsiW
MHDHKQCMALFAKLSEYIDNELDTATARTISEHLDHCKPCQVCLATLKRTVLLCRSASGTDLSVPDGLARRLRSIISTK